MFKVLNISDRNLVVGGFRLAPLEFHIFDDRVISSSTRAKINSLSNLGLIKVLAVEIQSQPTKVEIVSKKSNKKSK